MNKYIDCSKLGKIKESEFSELLLSQVGGTVQIPSKYQDMYDHIDIIWTYNNRTFTFDIKSAKKNRRADNTPDYNINWVELKNVRGNPGWLFGKADYIAFEGEKDWIVCIRTDIIKLIDSKVTNKSIDKSRSLYTYYQRNGRQDIVVKVLSSDLRNIARISFMKNIVT